MDTLFRKFSTLFETDLYKKAAFLNDNPNYGYNKMIDSIRATEFPHMKDDVYLDHAGATIYALSSTRNVESDLAVNLYGNPHSKSPSSALSTSEVDKARQHILDYFHADKDQWEVIFTANTTAAAKIVAESFPWKKGSEYVYFKETHTSIVGIRASNLGTNIPIDRKELEDSLKEELNEKLPFSDDSSPSLFSYPAQSNFNGARFPLSWIPRLRKSARFHHFQILLDAASYLTTSRLDLSDTKSAPDFITISFYKLFGFPTGLGALLVQRTAAEGLRKDGYFGGGTVRVTSVNQEEQWQTFRNKLHERFEDGTINFLGIVALNRAMDAWNRIFVSSLAISNHVGSLTTYLYQAMKSIKHNNGVPLCFFYFEDLGAVGDLQKQGPIITFNLRRADMTWVQFDNLEMIAGDHRIHLRTGTFCNPGAASRHFNIKKNHLHEFVDKNILCSDYYSIGGNPNGSIRISLGVMSTIDDVLKFLRFLKNFLEPPVEEKDMSICINFNFFSLLTVT